MLAAHIDAAAEIGALADADGGRVDVPGNLRGISHGNRFFRLQIAVDGAFDDDELSTDVRLDGALRADRQPLGVSGRSFHPTLDEQIFFGAQTTLEVKGRAADGGAIGRAVVRIAHAVAPVARTRGRV